MKAFAFLKYIILLILRKTLTNEIFILYLLYSYFLLFQIKMVFINFFWWNLFSMV